MCKDINTLHQGLLPLKAMFHWRKEKKQNLSFLWLRFLDCFDVAEVAETTGLEIKTAILISTVTCYIFDLFLC